MRVSEFQNLLAKLPTLTLSQRELLLESLGEQTPFETVAMTVNERLLDNRECPRCHSDSVYRWGKVRGFQRFFCRACRKTFTILTGTPLARLRHREGWIAQAEAICRGATIRRTAAECRVAPSTAFRWRHRWLANPNRRKEQPLNGIVEADETYFLENHKGSKAWVRMALGKPTAPPPNRRPRKRGGAASKRGMSAQQIPVLVVRDRSGATSDAVLPAVNKQEIATVLKPLLTKDTLLCTDGLRIYKLVAKEQGFSHRPLNLRAGIRVEQQAFHIQNVNAYHSRLKRWLRPFQGVATKYLPNYLGWRRMLEKHGEDLSPQFILSLAAMPG